MAMSWRTFVVAVFVLCAGWPAAAQVAGEAAVPRMSVADLKKAVDAGQVLIVDVRDTQSFTDGHLPGAVNMPLDELSRKLAALKGAKKPIVAYCA
jgi:3-mercaptopyruvate sulfurtransferase SseA